MARVFRRLGLFVTVFLLASLIATPVEAGNAPIASGGVQTDNGLQTQFVIFAEGSRQTGVVNFAFTGVGVIVIGGFKTSSCVYQDGNRLWAVGPETHHAGEVGGAPFEGSEFYLLAIEDNAGTGEPDRRAIYLSDEFGGEGFCADPAVNSVGFPAVFDVVRGDIKISQ